jgi:hypothetical protein
MKWKSDNSAKFLCLNRNCYVNARPGIFKSWPEYMLHGTIGIDYKQQTLNFFRKVTGFYMIQEITQNQTLKKKNRPFICLDRLLRDTRGCIPQNLYAIATWTWQGFQTYAPAAVTPKEMVLMETTNKTQPCRTIYYSIVPWLLNMFRAITSLETCWAVKEQWTETTVLHDCVLLVISIRFVLWCTDP